MRMVSIWQQQASMVSMLQHELLGQQARLMKNNPFKIHTLI
jgi:hypothetical protein